MSHETDGRTFVFMLVLISMIILWENKVKSISSSVFALALGMAVSLAWRTATETSFDFAPEIFLFLLLPPMLLNSSFSFEVDSLRKNWMGSLTFAFFGTLFSMIWIACGLLVWGRGTSVEMSVVQAFLFASVLAPTDTVATMSLTRSLDIRDKYIFKVLENESVVNDALAIVLVRLFSSMEKTDRSMDRWIPVEVMFWSVLSTFFSAALGGTAARLLNKYGPTTMTMHYMSALLIYGACEGLQLSGVLGLFVYGSIVEAPDAFRESVSSISAIVEAYVYLMLGLALHTYEWSWLWVSLLTFVSCVVGRVLMTFIIGSCLRACGREQWTPKSMLFFSMCGVRGAISYALSMSLHNSFIKSTTFVVIVCTIFVFGTLQRCLLRMLLM